MLLKKISPKMEQTWKYFKCDMELSFMVKSAALEYGWFGVSWNPSSIFNTPYSIVNSRLHEIDITTGGTHLITIPFSSQYECYDINENDSIFKVDRPKIYITSGMMGTLANLFSATVEVKGRFVDWSTFGVSTKDNNLPPGDVELSGLAAPRASLQMDFFGTASAVYQSFQTINSGVKAVNEFVGEGRKVGGSVNEAYETVSNLWGNGEQQNMKDVNSKPETKKDRVEHNSRDNSVHNAPTFYSSMSQIGVYVPENENLSFSMHDLPPRHLFDKCPKKLREIAQIPCLIQQTDCVAGTTFDLACRPFRFNTQGGYTGGLVDYFVQVADLFRWWRGSIDYEFTFHTSSLITAEFVFQCAQIGTMNPLTAGTLSGWSQNFSYVKNVNVSGYSSVKIRVPFIFNSQWCPMRPEFGTPTGVMIPIQPSILRATCKTITSGLAGSGAIPHVYVTVKRSAGPDIQFRNLNGGNLNVREATFEEEVEKGELQMIAVQQKEGNYDNICMGSDMPQRYRYTPEDDFDVITVSSRWSTIDSDTSGAQNLLRNSNNSLSATSPVDVFFRIQNWFRYVRGNVQCKIKLPEQVGINNDFVFLTMDGDDRYVASDTVSYSTDTPSAGSAYCVRDLNPILQFEAPLEGDTEWLITNDSFNPLTGNDDFALEFSVRHPADYDWGEVFMYCRAGRAYNLAFLQPPCRSFDSLLRTWLPPA